MNGSVFWRLVWKEYRAQQALWIALAVLTVVVQLLLLGLLQPGEEQVDWLFGFALGMAAAYGLGCGATLFAAEHEAGTYSFQHALPASKATLFSAKVFFAAISTLGLAGLLWSLSAALAGWRLPAAETHAMIWAGWGFAMVEALVWAVLFSLLLQSPLKAAILGVAAASVTVHLLAGGPQSLFDGRPYLAVLPARIVLAAMIAGLDVWIGLRWFRQMERAGTPRRRIGTPESEGLRTADSPLDVGSRGTMIARLLWQQWRQSGWMLIGLTVVSVLLILPAVWRGLDRDAVLPPFLAASVLAAALIGVYAFHGDQRDRGFRFFAERGIAARDVWLSRQLFWIGVVLIWTFALMVLFLGLGDTIRLASLQPPWAAKAALAQRYQQLAGSVAAVALACAAGQLCSLFVRSGILATVGTLVLICLLYAWCALMAACGMSWLWSVIPIPFVLLLASWLRAPDWLVERNTWRAWVRPVFALVLPAALLFGAFVFARIHQIPLVDPGFSVEEYGTPASAEAQATAEMYLRAIELYRPLNRLLPPDRKYLQALEESQRPPPSPEELAYLREVRLKGNQGALVLALKASERPECDFFEQAVKDLGRDRNQQAGYGAVHVLLTTSGEQLEAEGKLDAALERHVAALRYSVHLRHRSGAWHNATFEEERVFAGLARWAAHAQQTPERILAALPRVEKILKQVPPPEEVIKWEHWRMWREALAEAGQPLLAARDWEHAYRFCAASCRLPWERAHTLRAINYSAAKDLGWVRGVESAVAEGRRPQLPYWRFPPEDPVLRTSNLFSRWYYPHAHYVLRDYLKAETGRRACRAILALTAWKRAHDGRLPESLDVLAGKYLERLPLDPCSAEPFHYFPKGLPMPVHYRHSLRSPPIVEAGKPFLWATGTFVEVWNANDTTPDRYRIREYDDTWRSPSSEMDVWASGWVYPVP